MDALDEVSGEDSDRLIKYFSKICSQSNNQAVVCISSRPLTLAGAKYFLEHEATSVVTVEDENQADIRAFLNSRFSDVSRFRTAEDMALIKEELVKRGAGVFQWIAWVTRPGEDLMATIEDDEESMSYILSEISGLSDELSGIYSKVLEHISPSKVGFALRIFEWLTLACRPLTARDLRYAACLDPDSKCQSLRELESIPNFCTSEKILVSRATRISGGLVRESKVFTDLGSSTGEYVLGGQPPNRMRLADCLQLDHESVYEFMKHKGLELLQRRSDSSLPSSLSSSRGSPTSRHLRLMTQCLKYLVFPEFEEFVSQRMPKRTVLGAGAIMEEHQAAQKEPPFVYYAASQWAEHAAVAESDEALIDAIIHNLVSFPVDSWSHIAKMQDLSSSTVCHKARDDSTILHIICAIRLRQTLARMMLGPDSYADRLESKDAAVNTPLAVASQNGSCHAIRIFLPHGASADTKTWTGMTPLHLAAMYGHEDASRLLLDKGSADVDAKNIYNHNPLHWAVLTGRVDFVRFFLERSALGVHSKDVASTDASGGTSMTVTPLMNAFTGMSIGMMKLLLTSRQLDGDFRDRMGCTMLRIVSSPFARLPGEEALYEERARLLIRSGKFPLNKKNNDGLPPLMYASTFGHSGIVEEFLQLQGVKVNARDSQGQTSLHHAALSGHFEVLRIFLNSNRVNVKVKNHLGANALVAAIVDSHEEVIKVLLGNQGLVDQAQSDPSKLALTVAIRSGRFEMVKLLLRAVNIPDARSLAGLILLARQCFDGSGKWEEIHDFLYRYTLQVNGSR